MAKGKREPERDLTKFDAPTLPSYLQTHTEEDTSLDTMQEFRVIARVKMIQSMASSELLELFDPGDVIASPVNQLICKHEKGEQNSFRVVPLMFFPEWCKRSDRKDMEARFILERSFDADSVLARRSKDPRQREEKYDGDKYVAKYCEHLNFIILIYDPTHEFHMETFALSYSVGEHFAGANFISACSMRGGASNRAPLWSQVWDLVPIFRDRGTNKWWGMDHRSPPVDEEGNSQGFILEEEVELFKGLHEELFELHAKKLIIVDQSEGDEDAEPTDDSNGNY